MLFPLLGMACDLAEWIQNNIVLPLTILFCHGCFSDWNQTPMHCANMKYQIHRSAEPWPGITLIKSSHMNPFRWNRKSMASMKQCFNFLKHVINLLIYFSNPINILSMHFNIFPHRSSKSKTILYLHDDQSFKGHAISLIILIPNVRFSREEKS